MAQVDDLITNEWRLSTFGVSLRLTAIARDLTF